MANFFRDNADLRFHMAHAAWDRIVPFLEDEYGLAAEGGPATLDEAREVYDAVLDLAGEISGETIAPDAAEVDREGARLVDGHVAYAKPTQVHLKVLAEAGLLGCVIERRYGGQNLPTTLYTATVELISRACASLMTVYALQGCGDTLQTFATEDLKRRFVPGIASGEVLCCMSLSEPNAGSALGSVMTKATPVDEAKGLWRLEGTKVFSTNGGADLLLVLARTEEGTTDARGLSLFAVPRSPQVKVTKLEEKLGIHGSPTALLVLEGAEGYLVGERRRGLVTYVMSLIHGARLEVAAQALGISQAALGATAKYVAERRQFGHAIEDFAPVRQMVVEMEVLTQASRNLVYTASEVLDRLRGLGRMVERHPQDARLPAWRAERDRLSRIEDVLTPLTKYWVTEAGNAVAYRALQCHGGYGYVREYPVERHVRDVRVTNLYEGTSEIQVGGIVAPLLQGGLEEVLREVCAGLPEDPADQGSRARWQAGVVATREAVRSLSERSDDKALLQLRAKALADMVADVVAGAVFLRHAPLDLRKRAVCEAFLRSAELRWADRLAYVVRGDRSPLDAYGTIISAYR